MQEFLRGWSEDSSFSSSNDHNGKPRSQSCEWYVIPVKAWPMYVDIYFKLHIYFWVVGWDPELPQPVGTLNIPISECEKLVKVIINFFTLWISVTKRSRKYCSSQHLTLFTWSIGTWHENTSIWHYSLTSMWHALTTKHALIFLKSMVNEHRI